MARWKALPAGMDPAVMEFVGELRLLKDASGLTQRRLAGRTGYSTSSWERYLGGRLLPPREAVVALADLAAADPARVLARHEAAAEVFRRAVSAAPAAGEQPGLAAPEEGQADSGSGADDFADPAPAAPAGPLTSFSGEAGGTSRTGRTGGGWLRLALTAVVSAALGATVSGLIVSSGQGGSPSATAHPAAAVARQIPYACTYVRRQGLWYAGNSTTRTDALQVDDSGPEVAELQCLLQHAGISPGGVDGGFGPLTESAVIQFQKTFHLDIDGQVGPKTWAALRG